MDHYWVAIVVAVLESGLTQTLIALVRLPMLVSQKLNPLTIMTSKYSATRVVPDVLTCPN